MGLSLNTNVGAFVALQNLTKTTQQLEQTQLRITTGLRVNGPKDDGANYAISQKIKGDIAGTESVKLALANGDTIVNTAISAGKSIADLLTEMKGKTVQANQVGLDAATRSALNNDFGRLRDQITSIITSASFSNTNLITSQAATLAVLSSVEGSTINVSAQIMDVLTLGISTAQLASSANALSALTLMNTAILSVSDKLSALGSSARQLEIQQTFTQQLIDIFKESVGNLVDANLAEEGATLQSLQIKQQLGVQALAIANAGPQSILGLFQ
tara:strand:- start:152 stop:967 length:816 start_codon:yes stop_codon:yes gene_type:complete